MAMMPKELRFTLEGKECKAVLVNETGAPTSSTAQCAVCLQSLHDHPFYTTTPHYFDVHVDCARRFNIIEPSIPTGDEPHVLGPCCSGVYPHQNYPYQMPHGHAPSPPPPPPPPHPIMGSRSFGLPPYYVQNYYYSYPPNIYYAPYHGNWYLYQQQPSYYYPPNYYYYPPPTSYHHPQLQGLQHTSGLGAKLFIAAFGAFLQALFSGDLSLGSS